MVRSTARSNIRPLVLTAVSHREVPPAPPRGRAVILAFPGHRVAVAAPAMARDRVPLTWRARAGLMLAGACSGLVLAWMCTLV